MRDLGDDLDFDERLADAWIEAAEQAELEDELFDRLEEAMA